MIAFIVFAAVASQSTPQQRYNANLQEPLALWNCQQSANGRASAAESAKVYHDCMENTVLIKDYDPMPLPIGETAALQSASPAISSATCTQADLRKAVSDEDQDCANTWYNPGDRCYLPNAMSDSAHRVLIDGNCVIRGLDPSQTMPRFPNAIVPKGP